MTTDDRKLVLVVDADHRFIDSTRDLLQAHRVLGARTLDEAREIVLGGRVDIVVLGAGFASEHSIEESRALRVADPSAQIVLAADVVTNRLLKAALRAGFADVVDLPLTVDALASALPPGAPSSAPPQAQSSQEIELFVEPAPVTPQVADHPVPEAGPPPLQETSGAGDISTPSTYEPGLEPAAPPRPADVLPWGAAPPPVQAPRSHEPPLAPREPANRDEFAAPPVWPDEPAADRVDPPAQSAPHPEAPVQASPPPVAASAPPVEPPPAPPMPAPRDEDPRTAVAPMDPPPPAPFPPGGRHVGEPRRPSGPGRVIAVMAGKGGSGKSVVATNLAVAMGIRTDPERVAIVDADLQFGDVALMLQVDPVRTIDDVIGQLDSMTDARLDGALLRHESGLRVLPAPLLPVRAGEIQAKSVVEVVDRLRSLYDTIVVDTGAVFDDGLVTILEHADAVIAVVDMDLPSVKNAKVALDALRTGGFPMDRITLVVNRVNSKARLDLVELERSLGLRVGGSVPSDRLVPQSVNEGIPLLALSPRSKVARSFMALAERLDPRAERDRLGGRDR